MTNEAFITKIFLAGCDVLSISGNDIESFKSFWGSLNIQFAAAHKQNSIMYVPDFHYLSPHQKLRDQVYPSISFSDSSKVNVHID